MKTQKNKYTGKFVVAFDTIVEGTQCFKDDKGQPLLFDSYDEAYTEMFDDNLSMLESHAESGDLEELNEGVTPALVKKMRKAYDSKEVKAMEKFMNKHKNCNDAGTWVEKAEDFILGRKAIFTGNGVKITGKKLD